MNDCYFCQSASGVTDMAVIHELSSTHFIFAWDHNPTTPGHALIFPKRHVQFMKDLDLLERNELIGSVLTLKNYIISADLNKVYSELLERIDNDNSKTFIIEALHTTTKFSGPPTAFNDGINDGPAAGQTVPHFHWHVMPRWNGDTEDPRGGIRHMFTGKGNYANNR